MERVIKFRGKRIDNGEWVYGSLIKLLDPYIEKPTYKTALIHNGVNISDGIPVHPETVGQFINLLDKNGAEIYEGDSLSGLKSDTQHIGFVEWNQQQCGFIIRCSKYIMEILSLAMDGDENGVRLSAFEIIGNIYKNPELLNEHKACV